MSRYIDVEKFLKFENERCNGVALIGTCTRNNLSLGYELSKYLIANADVVEVVRCKDCKYCACLDKHSEINTKSYYHCDLWHGEETKNVWHKYIKEYRDYSIVEADDFCSWGERCE